jgi:ABC-type lipoprotein export system ATPase subunit
LADESTGRLNSQSEDEVITPLCKLNRELEITCVIVSHNHAVVHQTDHVLVMQDGKIVDDHCDGDSFEEDLKAFRDSGLGQALIQSESASLDWHV